MPSASMGATKLSQADMDGLATQMRRCFVLSREQFNSGYHPSVIFNMNPNGTVRREVQVVSEIHSKLEKDVAVAAIHAFRDCAPYRLPVAAYDDWKQINVTFVEK